MRIIAKVEEMKIMRVMYSKSWQKLFRFLKLYGARRTVFKAWGRSKFSKKANVLLSYILVKDPKKEKNIGLIGCGQFGFATIGCIVASSKRGFKACYDIDPEQTEKFAQVYRTNCCSNVESFWDYPLSLVYIASNHASHTEYAAQSLERGVEVYIEKPVSVSYDQFSQLVKIVGISKTRVYVGYNRPFSGAIRFLKNIVVKSEKLTPLSMNCFISGHNIPPEHWYRNP